MVARVLTLLAALVVAALGAALVLAYVGQAEERASRAVKGKEVLVAAAPIAAGTTVQGALTAKQLVPKLVSDSDRFDDAILTPTPEQLSQRLVMPMAVKQQLVPGNLEDEDLVTRLEIAGSTSNAVQIAVGEPNRLSGFLKPGDTVAVYLTYTPAGEGAVPCTRLLVESVTVIAVDGRGVGDAPEQAPTGSGVILEVQNDNQANVIQAAATGGQLYFVLLGNPEAPPTKSNDCVNIDDALEATADPSTATKPSATAEPSTTDADADQ